MAVVEIEKNLYRNHQHVRKIEPEGEIIGMRDQLCDDTADITEGDEGHKEGTFALGGFGSQRTHDCQRPRQAEADDHQCFK